jgi:hypothetical protein
MRGNGPVVLVGKQIAGELARRAGGHSGGTVGMWPERTTLSAEGWRSRYQPAADAVVWEISRRERLARLRAGGKAVFRVSL